MARRKKSLVSQKASPPAPAPYFVYIVTPQQVATSDNKNNPVTLYFGINNPEENGFVLCPYIELAISIGDLENDLTDDWQDVEGQYFQSSWRIQKLDYVSSPLVFQIKPESGITGLEAGESIGFELTGININNAAGPASVRIIEATDDPARQTRALINKVPPSLQITLFEANPTMVQPGGQTVLSWATTGSSTRTIVPLLADSVCQGIVPPDPIPETGEIEICPAQTTPFTLTACADGGGQILRSFSVVVQPEITSFSADPQSFVRGESVTLAWVTEAATSCAIDQGVGQVSPPDKGSVPVSPQEETTYTLTAKGLGASAASSKTVTPQPQGWGVATAPAFQIGINNLAMLAYQNRIWIIDTASLTVFSSADGESWTPVEVTQPWTPRTSCGAVVFNNMMWLIGGGDYVSPPNDIYVSTDGSVWSKIIPTADGFLPRSGHGCVVFQNRIWAFGGMKTIIGPYLGDVWSSDDGFTWTQRLASAAWGTNSGGACAVFNNQIWMCGGMNETADGNLSAAWYTSDGITWQQWNDGASPPSTITPWKAWNSPAQTLNGQLCLIVAQGMWAMDANMAWSQPSLKIPWNALQTMAAQVYGWRLWLAGDNVIGNDLQPGLWNYTP